MKFAVIGCGSMGTRRIRHVQDFQAGEVIGFNRGSKRRVEVEQEYGIRTVGKVEDLVNEDPDAVFICVPPAYHLKYLRLAIAHGWHFMSEQPLAHVADGLDALLNSVEEDGLIAQVSSNMRFHQSVRKMEEVIRADKIGPVVAGWVEKGEWLPDWHPSESYTEYYPSRSSKGGGLDFVLEFDWLTYLFGHVRRMACLANKRSSLDIDTDDVVQILMEFENGPQVVLHSDMIQRAYSRRAKFIGEAGTVEWDWEQRRVRLYRAGSRGWETFKEYQSDVQHPAMKLKPGWEWAEPMYLEDTRVFIERLENGDSTLGSLKAGIENLRLVTQAIECSRSNQVWQNPRTAYEASQA